MEGKAEVRKRILKIRDSLDKGEIRRRSAVIIEKLLNNENFKKEKNILIYIDYGSEVITRDLLDFCISQNKRVACPKVLSDGEMEFYLTGSLSDLKSGYRGILEPESGEKFTPDSALVIVPGVVFDREGYRIGYGKGFYDRYLEKHSDYKTIALAFSCQIVDSIPREEHDIKIMQLITD